MQDRVSITAVIFSRYHRAIAQGNIIFIIIINTFDPVIAAALRLSSDHSVFAKNDRAGLSISAEQINARSPQIAAAGTLNRSCYTDPVSHCNITANNTQTLNNISISAADCRLQLLAVDSNIITIAQTDRCRRLCMSNIIIIIDDLIIFQTPIYSDFVIRRCGCTIRTRQYQP